LNLNQLIVLLIELHPETLAGLEDLKKELEFAAAQAEGRLKELLRQSCDTVRALPDENPEARQLMLEQLGKLLEQAQEMESPQSEGKKPKLPKKNRINKDDAGAFIVPKELDPDLLSEFVTENLEYVNQAEASLLGWEKRPDDKELLNTIFRAFHTIKGTSAFVNLSHVKDLAHQVESLLARIRDGQARYMPEYVDLVLNSLDMLKTVLNRLKTARSGQRLPLPEKYESVIQSLKSLSDGGQDLGRTQSGEYDVRPGFKEWLVAKEKEGSPHEPEANNHNQNDSPDSTIRVRLDRLDRLLDMVGELVIAQSMVAQDEAVLNGGRHELAKKISHASKIVRELQDLSMYLRMVPLKPTYQKMARLVRDLAQKSGKMINFIGEGAETEIDRNMVDLITDPLIHMIRNAVDHGLETPEERRRAGKSGDGCLNLLASHSEGNIMLQVGDDGRGLSRERILSKAREKGLVEDPGKMSDQEVWQLIFHPGFSTAEKVTEVSGRGVGLDVVYKAVETLHGRIEIENKEGQGCNFILRLPLTMAITDGMVVKVGEQKFILPIANIQIAVRPAKADVYTVNNKAEMLAFRDEMVPIFRLHKLFTIPGAQTDISKGLLVIIREGLQRCAVLVDDMLTQSQVVTKSLGDGLDKISGISGGAIMGDGLVGLILDARAIINMSVREV
jgi:two-component system chemotaxis sensor kinase CheA